MNKPDFFSAPEWIQKAWWHCGCLVGRLFLIFKPLTAAICARVWRFLIVCSITRFSWSSQLFPNDIFLKIFVFINQFFLCLLMLVSFASFVSCSIVQAIGLINWTDLDFASLRSPKLICLQRVIALFCMFIAFLIYFKAEIV